MLVVVVGAIAVGLVALLELAFVLSPAVPALLLLIPVTACSTIGGRRAGMFVAVLSAVSFAMFSVEPVGSPIVRVGADIVVLATFITVAVTVSYLTNRRTHADRQMLDEGRVELLRGVSHDLRSPLTTIRALASDLLAAGSLYDDATRERMLERIVDESSRLDRIVANLLSTIRIQTGVFEPDLQPEPLRGIVDRSVDRLLAGEHEPGIDVQVSRDLPDVAADPVQLEQVVTNLLENAIRHGASDVPIQVVGHWPSPAAGDDFVEVGVIDGGVGFDDGARMRLFQPFNTNSMSADSTGLGLAVCKAIVEAHGGTIWLREPGDPGARLCFTVPVARLCDDSDRRR